MSLAGDTLKKVNRSINEVDSASIALRAAALAKRYFGKEMKSKALLLKSKLKSGEISKDQFNKHKKSILAAHRQRLKNTGY